MSARVKIGDRWVGDEERCFTSAEVGINHNGDLEIARRLIAASAAAGCDAVKFQKRTVDIVYDPDELARPRESPFGDTNGDLKRGLELNLDAYRAIESSCQKEGLIWFASCWDELSVDFIEAFDPPCYKVASAGLTDDGLLKYHSRLKKPIILSTGMSTLEQIDHAVEILGTTNLILLHCTSTYPSDNNELNLLAIPHLRKRYGVPVGYSGHEVGLSTSLAAAVLGACMIERHITLDRSMWGSDQAASVEPQGFGRLVRDIKTVEAAMGDGIKRVFPSEIPVMKKLRRVDSQS